MKTQPKEFKVFLYTFHCVTVAEQSAILTTLSSVFLIIVKSARIAGASTSMGIGNIHLPLFNGKNYDYWSITMRALFTSQDLWEFVEDGFEEPADEEEFEDLTQAEKELLKRNRKKDSKALFLLYQAVHENVFLRIAAAKRSREAWETLKTTYQGMEKLKTTKLQLLRRDFETL